MATPPIAGGMFGGGGTPGAPPGPQLATVLGALANKTQNPGKDLSQQLSHAQGADPTMIMRQLESIKDVLGILFVNTFKEFPNAAAAISDMNKPLSKAMKHMQEAAQTLDVVGKNEQTGPQPVEFGPAMIGNNAQPNTSQAIT